jgi:hypothetical protein
MKPSELFEGENSSLYKTFKKATSKCMPLKSIKEIEQEFDQKFVKPVTGIRAMNLNNESYVIGRSEDVKQFIRQQITELLDGIVPKEVMIKGYEQNGYPATHYLIGRKDCRQEILDKIKKLKS